MRCSKHWSFRQETWKNSTYWCHSLLGPQLPTTRATMASIQNRQSFLFAHLFHVQVRHILHRATDLRPGVISNAFANILWFYRMFSVSKPFFRPSYEPESGEKMPLTEPNWMKESPSLTISWTDCRSCPVLGRISCPKPTTKPARSRNLPVATRIWGKLACNGHLSDHVRMDAGELRQCQEMPQETKRVWIVRRRWTVAWIRWNQLFVTACGGSPIEDARSLCE